jgi:predicted nucleic acid-binding protein
MSASTFIDTNVFIYHLDATDPRKHAIAGDLVSKALVTQDACISYQVVQECLNVVSSKASVPLTPEQAQAYLDAVLAPLQQVGASMDLFHRALGIRARWRYGFYDSLVIAAALSAGCTKLLSEDLQHGQRIESLIIIDPFREVGVRS